MDKEFDPMEMMLMQKMLQKPSKKWIVGIILIIIIGIVALYYFYPPFREIIDANNPFIDKVWLYTSISGYHINDELTKICEVDGCISPPVTQFEQNVEFKFDVYVTYPDMVTKKLEKQVTLHCSEYQLCTGYTKFVIPVTQRGIYDFKIDLYMWTILLGWQWVDGTYMSYTAT